MADTPQDKLLKALPKLPRPQPVKKETAHQAAVRRGVEGRAAAIKRGEDARKKARKKK